MFPCFILYNIVPYFLKARKCGAEKQTFLDNGRTHAAEERASYAVTSHNNRRGAASGVLCRSAPRSLLRNCAVSISVAVNQHATTEEAVFSVGVAPRLYNEDLTELELELGESS
jgi:hypothetical protein